MSKSTIVSRRVRVLDPSGMHLTPCLNITRIVGDYDGSVWLSNGRTTADCRSIIELMMLCAAYDTDLFLTVSGDDASVVSETVAQFFDQKFAWEV